MARQMVRIRGRSARIEASVHQAVDAILASSEPENITIPLVAKRSGVAPSTIYRRWGTINALIADVAYSRVQPTAAPSATGALASDLETLITKFADEVSSRSGRRMLIDLVSNPDRQKAAEFQRVTWSNLSVIDKWARERGESGFNPDEAIDMLIAPLVHRILLSDTGPTASDRERLLRRFMNIQKGLIQKRSDRGML